MAIILYILIYLVRLQQSGWEPHLDLFPQLRQYLDTKIAYFLPSPQAELLSGILLGNKKDLPADLKLALRDTSTLHIVVVSGQNLSLLAGIFLRTAGFLKRKLAVCLTIIVILGFVMLTGGQTPILRAAIMAILSYLAQIYGRQYDGFWTLITVAGLMLLINPAWITDLSFQLSFLATFGVVVISPILAEFLKKIPLFLRENLVVTFSAQLMVTPVIIQNFHQLSLVSIPTNLFLLWSIPYIMSGGLVLLVLGSISAIFGQVVAFALQVILTYFIYVVSFFASLPFAWEYMGEQNWPVWIGYYFLLAGILWFMLSLKYDQTENSDRP